MRESRWAQGCHFVSLCLPWALVGVSLMAGCSKKELEEAANAVTEKASSVAESVKTQGGQLAENATEAATSGGSVVDKLKTATSLGETGKIVLRSTEPIEVPRAAIVLHSVGDGRKNSLQITSYLPGAESTGSPSVFLHANTEIKSLAELEGKTMACNLFVERGKIVARKLRGQKGCDYLFIDRSGEERHQRNAGCLCVGRFG